MAAIVAGPERRDGDDGADAHEHALAVRLDHRAEAAWLQAALACRRPCRFPGGSQAPAASPGRHGRGGLSGVTTLSRDPSEFLARCNIEWLQMTEPVRSMWKYAGIRDSVKIDRTVWSWIFRWIAP